LIEVAVSAGSAKPFNNPGEPNYTAKQVEIEKDYEKDLHVSGSQGGSECVPSKQFL